MGSFKAAISAPNVSCEFKDGNYFTLHCPVNDNISLTKLIELVQNFIATEDGKEPEVFEEAKVTRKQGTKFKLTAASSVKFEQPMDNTVNEGANHFLIEFESKSQVWNSNHADRIETHLLGQIESLCRCRLEKLGDTILVKGDTEQDIQKAISKLDTVDKMTVSPSLDASKLFTNL